MLSERIASVEGRGWFMSAVADAAPLPVRIRREVSLIDTDGSIVRPDRVIEYGDGSILVIDYKFGHREPAAERKYRRQVARYAARAERKPFPARARARSLRRRKSPCSLSDVHR